MKSEGSGYGPGQGADVIVTGDGRREGWRRPWKWSGPRSPTSLPLPTTRAQTCFGGRSTEGWSPAGDAGDARFILQFLFRSVWSLPRTSPGCPSRPGPLLTVTVLFLLLRFRRAGGCERSIFTECGIHRGPAPLPGLGRQTVSQRTSMEGLPPAAHELVFQVPGLALLLPGLPAVAPCERPPHGQRGALA